MTLRRASDGRLYGTIEVLLIRELKTWKDEMETETIIGVRAPFGSIRVEEFQGERFLEKPDEFWVSRGFTITEPEILQEARRLSRQAAHA